MNLLCLPIKGPDVGKTPWRHRRRREGFTLIELLVVLLIIGILLAIAIPTFLSTTNNANNTAAQANLKTALFAADTYFTTSARSPTPISTRRRDLDHISIGSGLSYLSAGAAALFVWPPDGQHAICPVLLGQRRRAHRLGSRLLGLLGDPGHQDGA